MEEVFDFVWEVPKQGYRWMQTLSFSETGETKEGEFLTSGQPLGGMAMVMRYNPLKLFTGLFRTFAETSPTKEGVLTFANKYGCLGDENNEMLISLPDDEGKHVMGIGESFSLWHKEIMSMAQALELWDAVKEGNLEVLSLRIAWERGGVKYDNNRGMATKGSKPPYGRYMQWIASPEIHPERLERFRPGDLVLPSLYIVQEVINKHLAGRVSPRLLWEKDRTKLGLYIVPSSLIGALWLQFAQAVDGNKGYRRCEECRTWFELSPEIARTSKVYCSNACRSRAYRGRQEKARRLRSEGMSLEEIAKIVGTKSAIARRWIEGREE